jgi:hypothetical protein
LSKLNHRTKNQLLDHMAGSKGFSSAYGPTPFACEQQTETIAMKATKVTIAAYGPTIRHVLTGR